MSVLDLVPREKPPTNQWLSVLGTDRVRHEIWAEPFAETSSGVAHATTKPDTYDAIVVSYNLGASAFCDVRVLHALLARASRLVAPGGRLYLFVPCAAEQVRRLSAAAAAGAGGAGTEAAETLALPVACDAHGRIQCSLQAGRDLQAQCRHGVKAGLALTQSILSAGHPSGLTSAWLACPAALGEAARAADLFVAETFNAVEFAALCGAGDEWHARGTGRWHRSQTLTDMAGAVGGLEYEWRTEYKPLWTALGLDSHHGRPCAADWAMLAMTRVVVLQRVPELPPLPAAPPPVLASASTPALLGAPPRPELTPIFAVQPTCPCHGGAPPL